MCTYCITRILCAMLYFVRRSLSMKNDGENKDLCSFYFFKFFIILPFFIYKLRTIIDALLPEHIRHKQYHVITTELLMSHK